MFVLTDAVNDVRIHCNSNDITIVLSTFGDSFDGLIYPKGLSKNSSCMSEYKQVFKIASPCQCLQTKFYEVGMIIFQVAGNRINYTLPLRSCNTMNIEVVTLTIFPL